VFKKKLWSDAPFPDFEHLNAFESKFYCFGGDGGGNSGGGSNSNSNSEQNQRADAQEPIRGGRRAAAVPPPSLPPAQQATMDQVSTTAPPPQKAEVYTGPFTSQIAEDIYKSGPERPPIDVQKDFGVASIAPQAVVGVDDAINKRRVDDRILANFPPTMPEYNRRSDGLQKRLSSVNNQNLYNREPNTLNLQNVYEEAVSPKELSVDFLGGALSPDVDLENDKYGFKYVRRFNQGGIVSLLEPLGDYLGNQIDQQRVDPFLEMVENAAYQEFGIDPSSGGGGMGSVGFDLPGETFGPGQMEPLPKVGFEPPELNQERSFGFTIPTTGQDLIGQQNLQITNLLGAGPNIGNETVQPDFGKSAQDYFNPGMGGQRDYGPGTLSPDRLVQQAQGRLANRDVKPKALTDYLNNVIQTGGNPTMMAPVQGANLLGVGPGGGVSSGQAFPSTNPYQAQLFSAFGGIGSLF